MASRIFHCLKLVPSILLLAVSTLFLSSCDSDSIARGPGWKSPAPWGTEPPGFRNFIPVWNNRIHTWLENSKADLQEELRTLTAKSEQAETLEARRTLKNSADAVRERIETINTRLRDGDYFQFKTTSDIPKNLVWENGLDNPDLGDPRAKKGGTVRLWEIGSYPSTFRRIGPNSNNGFRSRLYDEIGIDSIGLHPVTGKIMPGVCNEWAVSEDGRTVYYKVDPDARYTDGAPVKAIDFLVSIYIRCSDYANSPFDKDYYREEISTVTWYNDSTFSVTLPTQKPLMPYKAGLNPVPPHFYSEYGPDFTERYQWRVEPTAGAYYIQPEGVIRGQQVTMTRVKDWWAKDKKFYRNTCNVDNMVFRFIAEESKALELFRVGELDMMLMLRPNVWHDKMEIAEVHNGFIERSTFYNIYPRYPAGLFLNTARPPFNDLNFRLGFQHSINMKRVNEVVYRGDYQQLNSYAGGYGRYTNPNIKAREYSPAKAREYFAKAGYTKQGPDGILRKEDGSPLKVEITYSSSSSSLKSMMILLKEDARKAGVDLQLDELDSNVSYRKVMEKLHQATYWSWGFTPPHPRTHQSFHSSFAYDEKGNTVPNTNNINSISNEELDKAVEAERKARTEDELQKSSWLVQDIVHDLAIWVPGYAPEFTRIGYWRWVKWPNSDTTKFSYPVVFDPTENHLYWVDEELKEETLDAKRHGEIFPEQDVIYDQYRFVPQNPGTPSSPTP